MSTPPPLPPPSTTSTTFLPLDALFSNPLFAGGVGLASLGAAAALARRWTVKGASLLKRRLLVAVEISKKDESYPWILSWLSLRQAPPGFLNSRLTRIHHLSMHTSSSGASGRNAAHAHFSLQPGYGRYVIRHEGAWIMVNREKTSTFNHTTGEPFETVTFTTLYAQREVFRSVFQEAHELAVRAQEGKLVIYNTQGFEWAPMGKPRRKRPLESVVLDRGVKETIVQDVEDFLQRQQWYVDRGIPYRRGYLLYGPPGSGKSSFIQALAGHLDYGVAMINLSERGMQDDKLAMLLTKLPARTILLLEDADAAFVNRRTRDDDGYSGSTVTFSGLLNALDGLAAGEERIAFLTTNHIDRLDEALIRPGRVDMTVRIGEASRYQAGEMWDRFYGDIDAGGKEKKRFLKRLEELGLLDGEEGERKASLKTSTAAIQGLFIVNKDDMGGAIEQAEGLIPRIYEKEEVKGRVVAA